MILYYATTYYQLICSIVHRKKYHTNKQAVLAVDHFIVKSCSGFFDIEDKGIFDSVIAFNYIDVKENDDDNLKKIAMREIEKLPCALDKFEKIYVSSTCSWVGIYLAINKITFSAFEECCGILSKIDKLKENVRNFYPALDAYAEQLGLYDGSCHMIEELFCSGINDENILQDPKVHVFEVVQELKDLPEDVIANIIRVFTKKKKITATKNCAILLTQHFANLDIMDWEEQKEIYCIVADYFLPEDTNLIIKNHPADIMVYEDIFADCFVLRENIPAELLPFLFTELPEYILTVSSTAIDTIGNMFNKKVIFDFDYEKCFPLTHEYYAALKLFDNYVYEKKYKFYIYGVHSVLLENLNKYSDASERKLVRLPDLNHLAALKGNNIVYLDDDMNEDELKQVANIVLNSNTENIFVFLNTGKKYTFFDNQRKSLENNLYPVEVKVNEIIVGCIYIYSKGSIDKLNNVYKTLNYEKGNCYTEMFQEDALRAKVLEGILKATEERLRFYISREQELLKELEKKS